ncbi:MAG: hydroxyacylglutathione hydrolase [Thioclava marina]|jgi:hydroxyacylglutathione hydrolase|uniref:Hydroxyacylglutathione hydrolase n=1 Tax=Thioclava marina TaxID=1915077 RepID=A0ABX3MLU2_9RHOB|nr:MULTISPECIES: hydroxyacylglutathione hydrolase [Thioclava]TNE92732.1 MAG: hydroxyacylglutathione hydrolase [Paracoccaceae bacterium]MBC7144823.1 hydroxyacylglutathione hydrolase [Thioclava marina]MBD3802089.1 hydroxyacylglutathione hydrolase [Thioclava sp.]OOY11073.1 hydroxyacylglutathione hydrolase [Thioclava marina]OOY27152.1 hydroxyacylglutathione hydrolase [Thioclava sp. L04-15]
MAVELLIVPCLADNYAYVVHEAATDTTTVIDVPEAPPVLKALTERGWKANLILITHHHADHIDGVKALSAATGAKVIGAAADAHRLPPLDQEVAPGEKLAIGMEHVEVMPADGHTVGHVAYYFPEAGLLFSGDSLMSWGCGRLFEGSAAQMFDTLTRFSELPDETLVCSGHEYTEANGRFALSLEPDNPNLLARMEEVRATRAQMRPTLPVELGLEKATNPFLRGADSRLRAALGLPADATPLAVFTEARARKDRF